MTGLGVRHRLMNFRVGPYGEAARAKSLPGSQRPSVVRASSQ
jgi:hypothetical protein